MGTICQQKVNDRKNGILKDTGLDLRVEPP